MTSIYTAPVYKMQDFNNLFIELTAKNCNKRCQSCYIDFPASNKIVKYFISIDKINNILNDNINVDKLNLNIEYEEDLKYDSECEIIVIQKDKYLYIVEKNKIIRW